MKRLLCILDSLDAGGAETFLMKISRSIPVDQYKIDFIVSKDGGVYSEEILERGSWIYVVPPRRKNLWKALLEIKKIVKINNYNCVLRLGDSPIVSVDLIAAKLGGARSLGFRTCNALIDLSKKEKVSNWIMRPILNRIANIKIAPSMLAAEITYGANECKNVEILHNGVDLDVFGFDEDGRKRIRKEFSLEGKFVVGHIGRFHKQKNHGYLIKVFLEIKKLRPDAILFLVGTGELEDEIKEGIKEFQLEECVIFAGVRFDIPQILSAMDVFVFPSLYEGMPNTVIEAQATGLPCLIADTITKEANITGLVSYLPLNAKPEKWAKETLYIADTPRRNTKEEFIKQGYDIKNVSKEFLALFEMLENPNND